MIYKTVPNCKICKHGRRKEIEEMHFRMVKIKERGSFQAFCNEVNDAIKVFSDTSYKSHFRGNSNKLPHFSIQLDDRITGLVDKKRSNDIRKIIEQVGLQIVSERLAGITPLEVQTMDLKEIISLLTAVNKSQDETERIKIKKAELIDKNKSFDEALNAALYGGKIKEAEIIKDVSTGSVQWLEQPAKEEFSGEGREGAE